MPLGKNIIFMDLCHVIRREYPPQPLLIWTFWRHMHDGGKKKGLSCLENTQVAFSCIQSKVWNYFCLLQEQYFVWVKTFFSCFVTNYLGILLFLNFSLRSGKNWITSYSPLTSFLINFGPSEESSLIIFGTSEPSLIIFNQFWSIRALFNIF